MTQGYVIGVFADVAASGRALVVAGTHLKAKEGRDNEEARRTQVRGVPVQASSLRSGPAIAALPAAAMQAVRRCGLTLTRARRRGPMHVRSPRPRTWQAEQLAQAVAAAADAAPGGGAARAGSGGAGGPGGGPPGVLVLGDFNAPPGSAACQVRGCTGGGGLRAAPRPGRTAAGSRPRGRHGLSGARGMACCLDARMARQARRWRVPWE